MEVGGSAERKEVCFRGESVGFVKIDNGHKAFAKSADKKCCSSCKL
jgi:hypothetical protein